MALQDQAWKTEQGTFYAINRARKRTYRRLGAGPWEQTDTLGADELSTLELVGHDKIDTGWYSVYRAHH